MDANDNKTVGVEDGVRQVEVKPETRNHKGSFIVEATYNLVDIDRNGWALICLDEYTCHYVDPDDLNLG